MPQKRTPLLPPSLRCDRCGRPWGDCYDEHKRHDNRVVVGLLTAVFLLPALLTFAALHGWI